MHNFLIAFSRNFFDIHSRGSGPQSGFVSPARMGALRETAIFSLASHTITLEAYELIFEFQVHLLEWTRRLDLLRVVEAS